MVKVYWWGGPQDGAVAVEGNEVPLVVLYAIPQPIDWRNPSLETRTTPMKRRTVPVKRNVNGNLYAVWYEGRED
jgi:hypothetical protein